MSTPQLPRRTPRLNILALPSHTAILFGLIAVVALGPAIAALLPGSRLWWPPIVLGLTLLPLRDFLHRPDRYLDRRKLAAPSDSSAGPIRRELAGLAAEGAAVDVVTTPRAQPLEAFGSFRRRYIGMSDHVAAALVWNLTTKTGATRDPVSRNAGPRAGALHESGRAPGVVELRIPQDARPGHGGQPVDRAVDDGVPHPVWTRDLQHPVLGQPLPAVFGPGAHAAPGRPHAGAHVAGRAGPAAGGPACRSRTAGVELLGLSPVCRRRTVALRPVRGRAAVRVLAPAPGGAGDVRRCARRRVVGGQQPDPPGGPAACAGSKLDGDARDPLGEDRRNGARLVAPAALHPQRAANSRCDQPGAPGQPRAAPCRARLLAAGGRGDGHRRRGS